MRTLILFLIQFGLNSYYWLNAPPKDIRLIITALNFLIVVMMFDDIKKDSKKDKRQ